LDSVYFGTAFLTEEPIGSDVVRPNIEIDWALHGRVKSYDEVTNNDLDQSYADIVKAGLEELEVVEMPDRDELLRGGSLENIRYTSKNSNRGVPTIVYSSFLPYSTNTMYVINTHEHRHNGVQGQEELFNGFARASPYIGQGVWSIGQEAGHWNGRGIADYYAALNRMNDRYERDDPEQTHGSEAATYVAPIKTPGAAYLIIDSQPSRGKKGTMGGDRTRYLHIDVVTDGIPIDGTAIQRAVGAFGYRLDNAQNPDDFVRVKTRVNATLPQIPNEDVVETIMEEERTQPPYPKALIVENPFRKLFDENQDEDMGWAHERYIKDLQPVHSDDSNKTLSEQLNHLLSLDHVYVNLQGALIEKNDTVNGYSISSVEFAQLPIGGGHALDSLWIEAKPNFVNG
jgi:hypothetical protein